MSCIAPPRLSWTFLVVPTQTFQEGICFHGIQQSRDSKCNWAASVPTLLEKDDRLIDEGCNFLNLQLRWIWNCILWLHRKPPQQMLSALWSSLVKKLPLDGPIHIPFVSLGWRLWLVGRREPAKVFSSCGFTHTGQGKLRDDVIRISLYILYFHGIRVQIGYHSYDWSFKSFNHLQVFPATRGALHPRSGTADWNPDQKSEGDPVGFLAKAISFNLHSSPLYPCYS